MPITHWFTRSLRNRACLAAGACLVGLTPAHAGTVSAAAVAVVQNVSWSPGDAERDGACGFEIFLKIAQLQQLSERVGLVGVGNHNGRLASEAERALEHVVLRGIPVAKVARSGGDVVLAPDALVIDAGDLDAERAQELMATCLERYGAPPRAAHPDRPTDAEILAIRKHLQRYHEVFESARTPPLTRRSGQTVETANTHS